MKRSTYFPYLGLIIGILAVSTASILIRFAQTEVPSFVIAAGRLTISSLLLAPFALKQIKGRMQILSNKERFLLVLSGVFLGLHFATWITSLEYTTVASSVVIVTTAPLWVAVLSPLLLKERSTKWAMVGLVVSMLGSVIVGLNSACTWDGTKLNCESLFSIKSGKMLFGNILALAGAFLSAGYLMVGRKVRNSLDLISYTFSVYSIAALILLCLVVIFRQTIIGYSPITYLWIIGLAVIPQLIGHSSFNWVLRYLPATLVSIALLGEPVGTVILSYLFLKESPTILEIVGGILILVGITIVSLKQSSSSISP
jgi:drug/metabolite transporter (DMT)-like permease